MATSSRNTRSDYYVCKYGYLHNYSKIDVKKILDDSDKKIYNSVDELKKDLEED